MDIALPADHWARVRAADLPPDPRSNRYADIIRRRASRYPQGNGDLNISVAGGDDAYGVYRYDIAGLKTFAMKVYRRESGYNGVINVTSIPWHKSFKIPSGRDGAVQIIDSSTGRSWFLWAAAGWSPYFLTAGTVKTLFVGAAYVVSKPGVKNGRVIDTKTPVDLRTWLGNCPAALGSGEIPRPITVDQLDAHRIEWAVSCYLSCVLIGPDGYAVSPGGKYERGGDTAPPSDGRDQPTTTAAWNADAIPSSSRFDLSFANRDFEQVLTDRAVTGVDRDAAWTIANACREFGMTVSATGPRWSLLASQVTLPSDLLWGLVKISEITVRVPPTNYLPGLPATTRAQGAERITY